MKNKLIRIKSRMEIQSYVAECRAKGLRVGFVPTMGALHNGHLSLVRLAKEAADIVIASIFVNPTQFAPGEDLDAYPRTEDSDVAQLESAGCDVAYIPSVEEMYPNGSVTNVRVEGLSDLLDGRFRPHFFYGVATVVARLFVHVTPDVAVFGEKDYQQLQIIKRMVRDLGFPIEIIGGPTIREADGLAHSSRNAYLNDRERRQAVALSQALKLAIEVVENGGTVSDAVSSAEAHIRKAGFDKVDYVSLVDPLTLEDLPVEEIQPGVEGRILGAAWMGKTRLIDNMSFKRPD